MLVTTTATAVIVMMPTMIAIFVSLEGHCVVQWHELHPRDCASRFCMLLLRNGASCDSIGTVFDWISTASQRRRFLSARAISLSVTRQLGHRSPHLRGRIHMFERNIRCSDPSSPRMNSRPGMLRAELLSAVPHWLATVALAHGAGALCRRGTYQSC